MRKFAIIYLLVICNIGEAQSKTDTDLWRAVLTRPDSNKIIFNFRLVKNNAGTVMYVINGSEKIKVNNIVYKGDSVFINMPVFESSFKAKVIKEGWEGVWRRGSSAGGIQLAFTARKENYRFAPKKGNALVDVTGRWWVTFETDRSKEEGSVGEFVQKGNKLYGTFLTPGGDYRYQEGIVTGKRLMLSGFDGGHAFLFTADIKDKNTIVNGMYYSGVSHKEWFTAVRNAHAKVSTNSVSMYMKPGEDHLDFHFPDLEGKQVSINGQRFKNKVVVVQILGSWCPNCMDETAFLSDYYNKNKQRGIEMVALAYEYSTDFDRSVKSLGKFQKRFDVQYPILVTGVTVSDTLKTEKTLPQVTPIKVFPSVIIIDKSGKVRKFETDFFGPGTGSYYEEYKKSFYATMDILLKEK